MPTYGKHPQPPPTGTPIGRRQREALRLLEQMTRTRGGRGTMWTGAGPFFDTVPGATSVGYCQPSGSLGPATGVWPNLTSNSITADVYINVSNVLVLVGSSATIYNWSPDTTTGGNRLIVKSNGDGTWEYLGEFCTTP